MCDCLLELEDGENPFFSDAEGRVVVAVFDDANDFWCCCC